MELGKHRIGHVKQLRLLDSSRKLIVERPSKLRLNAVDEREEPIGEPRFAKGE